VPRRVSLECKNGLYELVIRVPLKIETEQKAIVVGEEDLPLFHMTRREQEVMQLVCAHKTNKEIANSLHLSERTVKFHVSSLLLKSGCESRAVVAFRYGRASERGSER
jgi:DNA-binding NarL/FixJ family response regulator